jgi:uncharacterized protein with GYD domain
MPAYVSVFNWTEQGVQNAKETVNRAKAARAMWEKAGGRWIGIWWTHGQYDGVVIHEAPDAQTATRLLLSLAKAGNIRTVTMPAFSEDEMESIIKGLS